MVGSGVLVDESVGAWFSKFLEVEGCLVIYMGPRHKGRVLQTDPTWGFDARPENEVSFWICSATLYQAGSVINISSSLVGLV